MSDQPAKLRLAVLPSSGKAEQLRAEQSPERPPSSRPAVGAESITPNQEPLNPTQQALLQRVIETLQTVYDPELPVNIYELGLIYAVTIDPQLAASVKMTLTAPGCPVAGTLPGQIQQKIAAIEGITAAKVELVWDPPWDKSRMSEAAMLELGLL